MMNVVEEAARQAGYAPDCLVTADETAVSDVLALHDF